MDSDCIFDDGKAKTCTAEFAAATFIDAVEAFEKVVKILCLNPRSVITDRELIEMTAFGFKFGADDVEA